MDAHQQPEQTEITSARRHERFDVFKKARWDFYTASNGRKTGYITNISQCGCLLKTSEPIEHRRWIRILVTDESTNLVYTLVGRAVRRENSIDVVGDGEDVTLYRYGIEFTHDHFDFTFDFSSRNFSVRSCLNLNEKSSLREGFLA